MNPVTNFFRSIILWSYSRGSWQWDLMSLFIIVIVFATPSDFLLSYSKHPLTPEVIRRIIGNFLGF